MSRRRRSTIGASPLDSVVPRSVPERSSEREEHTGAPDRALDARRERAERGVSAGTARPGRKERLTVHVPNDLVDRTKNAVYWTPGLTLARLAERALSAELDRLENENGGPFPARAEELRGGRPMK